MRTNSSLTSSVEASKPQVNTAQLIYQRLFEETLNDIKALPPNELSYYLVLLVASIQHEKHPEKHTLLLAETHDLVLALKRLYQEKTPETCAKHLQEITLRLNSLMNQAQINTTPMKIKKIVLTICGVITGIIVGILGAIIGLGLGLFSQPNVLKGARSGFLCGLVIGIIIGFRLPSTLSQSHFENNLIFCLNSIEKICAELEEKNTTRFKEGKKDENPYACADYDFYQNETKKYIIETFLADEPDKEAAFLAFLDSEQAFQVCTTPSGLVDRKFDGTLGHHSLIRFSINGKTDIPIEFGSRKTSPRWVDQAEPTRHVSGKKLFEMLTLDRILQETHPKNLEFTLKHYQLGDNDCLTYVNKILIGTGQTPTKIKRFTPEIDTTTGQMIGALTRFTSATAEHELDAVAPFFASETDLPIRFFKRPPRGKNQVLPDWPPSPTLVSIA
ncbi:hypothetical protein [Legionella oakridgensis]|uniref:Uncharacterized protein n=2 Tax=Legionella oakridgensis TaxID=29423 RepID=W0BB48_9GAMM|nr:hypothetical protein [Legionella oakridgensis]AHE65916.1 hypothetical protein Loa_00327 [Legionella oakridgensis ATCC 33761 = DSM 21215]KTD43770.1 hypothetical protein Loak_0320 [Legionella oakridgensis]STY15847.1 Uncharacterised protein [Legionella longbeachae]